MEHFILIAEVVILTFFMLIIKHFLKSKIYLIFNVNTKQFLCLLLLQKACLKV